MSPGTAEPNGTACEARRRPQIDTDVASASTLFNVGFRKSVFGKADLDLGDFSKLTLEEVYGLPRRDWFIRADLNWSVIDGPGHTLKKV